MSRVTIALTGMPEWQAAFESRLDDDTTLMSYSERTRYVTRLADAHTALIVVDAVDADWRFWTATPKSSPATRRIPILVVADEADLRHAALLAGADLALRRDDFLARAAALVADYARVLSPATLEQLDCACDEALPELARQGVAKFNAGEYYKQHDLFEALWMQTAGPVRDLYRAVLQVGVAYFQIERGNYRGALKMLLRSVQWLAILPDVCQGIDVKQLREDSYRVRAELERLGEADFARFDKTLLKPVRLVDAPKSTG